MLRVILHTRDTMKHLPTLSQGHWLGLLETVWKCSSKGSKLLHQKSRMLVLGFTLFTGWEKGQTGPDSLMALLTKKAEVTVSVRGQRGLLCSGCQVLPPAPTQVLSDSLASLLCLPLLRRLRENGTPGLLSKKSFPLLGGSYIHHFASGGFPLRGAVLSWFAPCFHLLPLSFLPSVLEGCRTRALPYAISRATSSSLEPWKHKFPLTTELLLWEGTFEPLRYFCTQGTTVVVWTLPLQ